MVTIAGLQLDPQYRSLTRDRQHAAATKTRVMQVIDDPRNLLMRPLPSAYTKRKVGRQFFWLSWRLVSFCVPWHRCLILLTDGTDRRSHML